MRTSSLATFSFIALLAAPVAARAQQADTAKRDDKPVTPAQVAKNTEAESKRVANRTGKAVRKAGKQTEKQAKRTARAVKKTYSRKARQEEKVADSLKTERIADSVKAAEAAKKPE